MGMSMSIGAVLGTISTLPLVNAQKGKYVNMIGCWNYAIYLMTFISVSTRMCWPRQLLMKIQPTSVRRWPDVVGLERSCSMKKSYKLLGIVICSFIRIKIAKIPEEKKKQK